MTRVRTTGARRPGRGPGGAGLSGALDVPLFGDAARPEDLRAMVGIPLTDEQLAAATAPLEPGVVVAGAGSGKTTVMAARVVWLVATGAVRPDEVLGLTFTNKAAAQLLGKIRAALRVAPMPDPGGDEPGDPLVATYHAFAARLLTEHGLRLGIEPSSQLLSEPARYQLAYRVVCRTDTALQHLPGSPAQVVPDVLALDDALAEHDVTTGALRDFDAALIERLGALTLSKRGRDIVATAHRRRELADLVDRFRAAKLDRDLLDFADQVRLARRLAAERPEVGARLREQYAVVLLDEYQDTSSAQRHLLQDLFGDGHPVTAVGDPCQAIYGWRGASVHNIDAFPDHFPRRGGPASPPAAAARFPLSQNRRSGPRILDLANDIAGPLRAEHPGVPVLVAGATDKGPGGVRCALLETYEDEIGWLVDRLLEVGPARGEWRGIAVLCRAAGHFGALQAALTRAGIPVQVVGAAGLLSLPEVVELRAYLEVIHDPTANAAMIRLLTGPRWRIGPRDLAALGARAAHLAGGRARPEPGQPLDAALDDAVAGVDPTEVVSLSDAVEDPGPPGLTALSEPARERLVQLARELRDLRRHVDEPLVDLVHRVLAVTGLDVELAASPDALAAERTASVAAFVDLAAEFRDLDGQVSLGAFLARLRDAERFDADTETVLSGGRDAVTLMTVHKAKGLEFPVVALPFLVPGVFPSSRAQDRWPTAATVVPHGLRDEPVPPGLEGYPGAAGPTTESDQLFNAESTRLEQLEETRLAYVAVTRAERLLLASGHWWGPTQKTRRGPSDVLTFVKAVCERAGGSVDAWVAEPADGATNPALGDGTATVAWPAAPDEARQARLLEAAAAVRRGLAEDADPAVAARAPSPAPDRGLTPDEAATVASWDRDIALLLEDLRREDGPRVVTVPPALSTTQVLALARDEERFARELARPMPRPPAPAARRGTRFHAWVEARYGQQPLLEPEDVPGAADAALDSDEALEALQHAFLGTPYADLAPHAVEVPFALVLGGRVVRGRIDAVFRDGDRWEVVDWKTGEASGADPLQLAVYRLAWAEQAGVAAEDVDATFVLVGEGTVLRPADLPDRDALEALLRG